MSSGILPSGPRVIFEIRDDAHAVLRGRNEIRPVQARMIVVTHERHHDKVGIAVRYRAFQIPVHLALERVAPGSPRLQIAALIVNRSVVADGLRAG